MRGRFFVLAAALLVAAVPGLVRPPQPAEASHAWDSYHWSIQGTPLKLSVGDNVANAWDGYLNEAVGDWNNTGIVQLTKVAGRTTARQCRPTSGRVEVCNAAYGVNGWLGIGCDSLL